MEKINVFILCYLNCIHKHSRVLFCCMEVTIQHVFGNNRGFFSVTWTSILQQNCDWRVRDCYSKEVTLSSRLWEAYTAIWAETGRADSGSIIKERSWGNARCILSSPSVRREVVKVLGRVVRSEDLHGKGCERITRVSGGKGKEWLW